MIDYDLDKVRWWTVVDGSGKPLVKYFGDFKSAKSQARRDGWLTDGNHFIYN